MIPAPFGCGCWSPAAAQRPPKSTKPANKPSCPQENLEAASRRDGCVSTINSAFASQSSVRRHLGEYNEAIDHCRDCCSYWAFLHNQPAGSDQHANDQKCHQKQEDKDYCSTTKTRGQTL